MDITGLLILVVNIRKKLGNLIRFKPNIIKLRKNIAKALAL